MLGYLMGARRICMDLGNEYVDITRDEKMIDKMRELHLMGKLIIDTREDGLLSFAGPNFKLDLYMDSSDIMTDAIINAIKRTKQFMLVSA